MLNLKRTLAPLLLTMVAGGCGSPPEDSAWVASDDGMVALRLSAIAQRVGAGENIQVVAEIENRSPQKLTILRPFGDWYAAKAVGMKISHGNSQLRYAGPSATYVIGADAFAVVGPGEVVQDKLELTPDTFPA
jgi:hypothetical protein